MPGDAEGEGTSREVPVRAALAVALVLFVGIRCYSLPAVFRGGDVVLLSNDPYAYRYLVERALAEGAVWLANPGVLRGNEPLLVWTLAAASALLGGVGAAAPVLAWYPVVTGLCSALLVFALARTLTGDARVALTAVVVLAVTPLHVSRTALGFADHHAFDYLWLALTATTLVWLLVRADASDRRRWAVAGALGVAIASQTLTWRASPLMLVPVAVGFGVASLVVVRGDEPVHTLAPVVAGFGVAAVLTGAVHWTLGWQNTVVAGSPALLFFGGLVVLGLTRVVGRVERSWPTLLGGGVLTALLAGAVVGLAPGALGTAVDRVDAFVQYVQLHQQTAIGETTPITDAFGPVLGPLVLLGFAPFLGLPAVVWGLGRGWREREPGWFVLAAYVLWFLALAFVQRRWAVQLGLVLSVFAAVGFVGFAHWLALVRAPAPLREGTPADRATVEPPDRQRLALLCGLGAVGLGSASLFAGEIVSRVTIDGPAYRAAAWMREHAEDRGWTYPRNYVLAHWGRARMYNYLVNGESRGYGYARQNYEAFLFSTDAAAWYERLAGRVGFVVTRSDRDSVPFRVQARLHEQYGSAGGEADGVGHYRAVWESEGGSVKVFTLVPGATVTGTTTPDGEVRLSTAVTVAGTGTTVEYRRRARADSDGAFAVVLAHPGEYEVDDRSETLTVTESAVREGAAFTL